MATQNRVDSDRTTQGIRVRARAHFVAEHSDPDHDQYLFVYRITMDNRGSERARLKSRHWIIVDANGQREEVRGPGVVGEHPLLAPGESFEYQSRCPLPTPWGTMEGSYRFVRDDGAEFDVAVGRFYLVPGLCRR